MRTVSAWLAVLMVLVIAGGHAAAYEFEIDAQTVGQAYQLRSPRLDMRDVLLNRRRLTQSLGLEIWGILEPRYNAGRPDEPPLAPFDVYVSASARVLHDFGDYTQADVVYASAGNPEDVTAAVPELAGGDVGIEVLWAQIGARGILDRLDVALGRQIVISELDWFAFDGLAVAARLPGHVLVEGQAGLLVRDSSPLGSPTTEPDGSSSSQCTITLGGTLQPSSCAPREARAPVFGVALATHGLTAVTARVSYRRSVSRTDNTFYPDGADQSPSWGVLEEKLAASARVRLLDGHVLPYAAGRWNFLLGLFDEAHAGVRLVLGVHALTPEVRRSWPSFDGDSIFNVFSIEPFEDARLTYDVWPGRGRLRLHAGGFARRFHNSDTDDVLEGMSVAEGATAAGASAGARLTLPNATLRLDGTYEDGHGGQRAGGDLAGRWRVTRGLALDGRVSVVVFDEDLREDLRATSLGAQAGALWQLGPGMALHLLAEENVNRLDSGLRLLAVLDLAFRPEH